MDLFEFLDEEEFQTEVFLKTLKNRAEREFWEDVASFLLDRFVFDPDLDGRGR